MNKKLAVDKDRLADFCRRHHITRLAIFGSALRDDFGLDSEIDVLLGIGVVSEIVGNPVSTLEMRNA